jgi:hypothetical protein
MEEEKKLYYGRKKPLGLNIARSKKKNSSSQMTGNNLTFSKFSKKSPMNLLHTKK